MAPVRDRQQPALVLKTSKVSGGVKRAIFESTKLYGLYYAETVLPPERKSDVDPWSWTSPPRKISLEKTRPRYEPGETKSAKYRTKGGMFRKEMDLLRYRKHLFDSPYIKNVVLREIQTNEMLRQHPHVNLCLYHGVDYDQKSFQVNGLFFDRYDRSLYVLMVKRIPFDAEKCLRHVKRGIEHLHSLGLVHCDIKPDNIFVKLESQSFVLGDFDSVHEEGAKIRLKSGTDGWVPEDDGNRATYDIYWYSYDMLKSWIAKKGNGKPVEGQKYPRTALVQEQRQKEKKAEAVAEAKEKVARAQEKAARVIAERRARVGLNTRLLPLNSGGKLAYPRAVREEEVLGVKRKARTKQTARKSGQKLRKALAPKPERPTPKEKINIKVVGGEVVD